MCPHLKYLPGDLDAQIKETNVKTEKMQGKGGGKLKLQNDFLTMSVQTAAFDGCRRINEKMISHSSVAYYVQEFYGEGKFYILIFLLFL